MHEGKFKLELAKREKIINTIREERNKIFIQYQELNVDFVSLFRLIEKNLEKCISSEDSNLINNLKEKYKSSF